MTSLHNNMFFVMFVSLQTVTYISDPRGVLAQQSGLSFEQIVLGRCLDYQEVIRPDVAQHRQVSLITIISL